MWNNFESTTNEDETVNNVFCRSSLFKISADETVTETPIIQASVQNGKMVVAIGKNLILLEDENNTKCSLLCFESQIDQLVISQTGNIIICALSDGNVCGIYIKGYPVFKVTINVNDINSPKRTFIGINQFNNFYYLTCSNGIIYRILNVNEDVLQQFSNNSIQGNETDQFEETILDNVKLDRITETISLNEITANTLIKINSDGNSNEFQLIGGTQCFLKFQTNTEDIKIIIPEIYQGFKSIFNLENFVLALTNDGHLIEICPYTKIYFRYFTYSEEYLIDNLIVMENNNDSIELLILTKPNYLGVRQMKIIEFPSFKCIQELSVSQYAWLVNQPKSSVNLYYISGEKYNEINYPEEIEMKLVSETQPEQRLKKLIQKGYFDEAEKLAKQFNLSFQPIYELKAKKFLTEIKKISDNNIDLMEIKFNELLTTLKLIENKEFFIGIRSIEISSRKIMAQYLNEMLEHLKDGNYQRDILEIKEQQLRLETLQIIDPYECNLEWQEFVQHPNIIKVVTNLFKTDMLTACLLWKRHAASIIPHLDDTKIIRLLQMIPSETEPFNIIQWLRQFIPSIIQIHPRIMSALIEWNLKKIRSLQYSNYWPEIGLEFSTKVEQIFDDIQFLHSDINRQYESSMQKLRNLVNALQDLSVLKKSYNLIITLDNYIKDCIDETSLHILQRLQTNILKQFVKDFLYPVYMEKGQSPVNAIIKYITFLVLNCNGLTTWLERSIILIDLLHNEEEKLNCALMVLRAAPVPWPDTVNPLIHLRNSGHPLGTEINTAYELQITSIMKVKYHCPIDATDNNMKLVYRIVAADLPEMFEDIKNVIKSDEELGLIANFYCCYELARKGKIDKAIQFFNKLEDKEKMECSGKIVNIISNILEECDDIDSKTNDGLYEFLQLISPYSSDDDKKHIKSLLINRTLYVKFKLKIPQNQFIHKSERYNFLHKGIETFVDNLKKSPNDKNFIKYIWHEIIFLTNALNLENLIGVIELSKLIENIHLTSALVYYTIEMLECNQLNCDLFIELAVLLLSQQILIYCEETEEIFDPLVYPLAHKLLVKSLNIKQIFEMNKLLKWIDIGKNIYDMDIIPNSFKDMETINELISKSFKVSTNVQKRKYNRESISIFDRITISKDEQHSQKSVVDANPILKCLTFALLLVLIETKPKEEIFLQFSKYLPNDIIDSGEEITKDFYTSLEHLVKSKQHSSWYTIARYLLTDQENADPKIISPGFVSLQLRKMFRHLLTQKDVNFTDLLAMLIFDCSPKNLLDNLWQELKSDQQKVNFLHLSEIYYTHIKDKTKVDKYRDCRLKYFYYTELCKQDSSLTKKTDIDMIPLTHLIKELKTKSLDIKLLQKLSNDFDWDYESLLIQQIITILHYQELNFKLKIDPFGKEHLIVNTTVEEIRALCQPLINEIKNTELLAKNLLNFYSNINYYFYELYLCVIEILIYINALPKEMELHGSILIFLKHKMLTKRKNRPGHIEVEAWLKSQSEGGVLPKISKYRLPFVPIVQEPLKEILDYEINVDNCESWFPLIKLHTSLGQNISATDIIRLQDYFCMSAVKRGVSEYSQKMDSDDIYHLQPINNAFLQSILRLIKYVSDISKAFHILYFVANSAPDGADQVEAAYECYKYAIKNESELISVEKSKETVLKIKRKYPIFKIQHLLHTYGLVDDKLLQLVESPEELINLLYYHESLLKTTHPDINKIAKEIALLHNLDFHIIQLHLLKKLLSFNSSTDVQDLEETFYEDLNTTESESEELNTECVLRAHYILSSWESETAMQFLLGHVFPPDGTVNTGQQLQLCECFSKLIDDSNSNSSYIEILNQKQYIIFKCVYNLKHLGYNFTVDKFADYDKLNILKKIWQNHVTNSLAMEVIADICIGFDINMPKIWNSVLQQMVNLNMLKQLNALVDTLSCKMDLLHTDGLTKAWEYVLRLPFKTANRTRSFDQEELLCKSLFRIQGCPLVNKINLIEIAKDCIRLDRPHMAAVLLSFCSDNNEKDQIKMILIPHKSEKLKKDIIELEESGILRNIINYVIKEIEL